MIDDVRGDLLHADAEALVNTVNCVGVMGKGVALQFKQAYPEMAKAHAKACRRGEIEPGRMFIWETGRFANPRYVINFPTKRHWVGRSRYEDVAAGLSALVADVRRLGISSIAIPALGCGNGGLDWARVRPQIVEAFAALPEVHVQLFGPTAAPATANRIVKTKPPAMTPARAMLVLAMERYAVLAYETTQLEIQKLAYFLQEAGEGLRLQFSAQRYGPYAENLNKALEDMEGHLLSGFDGERAPGKVITLKAGAAERAREWLQENPDAAERIERLAALIEGFETPYGMELLSSVHWVGTHERPRARSCDEAVDMVRTWNARKATTFPKEHIRAAWDRLDDLGWLPPLETGPIPIFDPSPSTARTDPSD